MFATLDYMYVFVSSKESCNRMKKTDDLPFFLFLWDLIIAAWQHLWDIAWFFYCPVQRNTTLTVNNSNICILLLVVDKKQIEKTRLQDNRRIWDTICAFLYRWRQQCLSKGYSRLYSVLWRNRPCNWSRKRGVIGWIHVSRSQRNFMMLIQDLNVCIHSLRNVFDANVYRMKVI